MYQHHHHSYTQPGHQPSQAPPSSSSPYLQSSQRTRLSSAIPIVAPSSASSNAATSPTASSSTANSTSLASSSVIQASANASEKKPCRNVAIYGRCKYESEGCPFDHGSTSISSAAAGKGASLSSPVTSSVSKAKTSSTGTPSSPLKGALSARNAAAAVFVPKVASSATQRSTVDDAAEKSLLSGMGEMALNPPTFASSSASALAASGRGTPTSFGTGTAYESDGMSNAFDPTYTGPLPGQQDPGHSGSQGILQPARHFNPYEHMADYVDPGGGPGLGLGGGLEYYGGGAVATAAAKVRQPLQYHLYAPPLPHVSNLHPHHLSAHAFFLDPNQRDELQRKQEAMHASVPPPELGGPNLPEELHVYHSLVPLEHPGAGAPSGPGMGLPAGLIDPRMGAPGANGATGASGDPSKVFGYRSHSYKAICTLDGKRYVLRRLEGFRLQHETAIGLVERWRRIRHPSIVSVREAFTTRAFGDQSIVFVYDYHPLSTTLYAEHMTPKPPQPDRRTGRLQAVQMQTPEKVLWSYLCQLTSVLRCIHASGMAARCIEPSKILRTGKNRVRLNCCSIFDVIAYDPRAPASAMQTYQDEDLVNLGKLILSLCCNSMTSLQNIPKSLETIGRTYSADLKNVILWLLNKPSSSKNVDELGRLLSTRVSDELDSALNYNDLLENSLMRELENGRLVRLLCKFGFINERPEFDHDPRWAETGDRYIIKLFRDYVFHAVDEAGRPVVDLSHILTNLNKLDAGVDEKIMLTSRDEQSCLVVSYREVSLGSSGSLLQQILIPRDSFDSFSPPPHP
ncbi:hypothetical protein IE53DRAFT_371232 [Violaceomyces palustris]|uniref:Uncharacterized protein n=1 Tax=Violaceomyces palustris TaxID=1673888 RepID=A0ACD0NPI9_9BASI|nr:hypothetical protein IE53DRAFT_371232 [Violaceomyces palustris]